MGNKETGLDEKKFSPKELIYVVTICGAFLTHWYALSTKLDAHIAKEDSYHQLTDFKIEGMKTSQDRTTAFLNNLQFSPADKPKPWHYETEAK